MLWAALGLAGAAFAMAAQQMEIVKKLEKRIGELKKLPHQAGHIVIKDEK